jgi:ankyrin repeat protein
MNALMFAVQNGDIDIIKLLLKYGAKVDLKNKDGKTAYDLSTTDEIKNLLKSKL